MTLQAAWKMDTEGVLAARIYDGPDEVHRASVARQILRGYEAPADGIPTEHLPTRRERARAMLTDDPAQLPS